MAKEEEFIFPARTLKYIKIYDSTNYEPLFATCALRVTSSSSAARAAREKRNFRAPSVFRLNFYCLKTDPRTLGYGLCLHYSCLSATITLCPVMMDENQRRTQMYRTNSGAIPFPHTHTFHIGCHAMVRRDRKYQSSITDILRLVR